MSQLNYGELAPVLAEFMQRSWACSGVGCFVVHTRGLGGGVFGSAVRQQQECVCSVLRYSVTAEE